MMLKRIKTGIEGLDEITGGGFIKNSIITICGGTGSGRTTFGIQYLANGAYLYKERGMYISFDQPKYSLFGNMSSFIWNLPELEKNKQLFFIEYPTNELSFFLEKENALIELIDTLGIERVVIDPIGPLISAVDINSRKLFLQKLINSMRKWGTTTLLIADEMIPPDPIVPRTDCGIENFTDGFIHLGWSLVNKKRIRTLEVLKLRGSMHEHDNYYYTIDSNGIKILKQLKNKNKE